MPRIGSLSAHDRWQAVRSGVKPDRPPVSFWRHFYDQEGDLGRFVEAMVWFQRRFGWDLVKINPKASYHVEPWGVKVLPSTAPQVKPEKTSWPIREARDLSTVQQLAVTHAEFDFQLRAVAAIRRAIPRPLPMVMTVFTPLSILGDLVEHEEILVELIRESPAEVTAALDAITATFLCLAVEFLNAGADGLFFATTEWASRERLTAEEYRRFGRPHDLRILNAISGQATFTVLHVCGATVELQEFADYPCEVVNWDATHPTNPALRAGWNVLGKPILGGLDGRADLLNLSPATVTHKVQRLVSEHADLPYAVGPGCAVPVQVPLEVLQIVKDGVEQARR